MTKRLITLLAIFSICLLPLLSQEIDQVILKNGSVIRGSVSELEPDGELVIDDLAGNTWVFNMDEVAKIEQSEMGKSMKGLSSHTGIMNMTTIGFLAGSQSSQYIAPFSMQTSFGYKLPNGFYSGLLAGLEFLNVNHIPVMLDFQYDLGRSDVTPVIIARAGYVIPTKFEDEYYGSMQKFSGGAAGSLGLGLRIDSRQNFSWNISMLYRYMQINYEEEYDYLSSPNIYKDVYNRLELRFGFYFGI